MMKINEINVEHSGNFQRYINECCESESDGKMNGFSAGCCKFRWRGHCCYVVFGDPHSIGSVPIASFRAIIQWPQHLIYLLLCTYSSHIAANLSNPDTHRPSTLHH